MKKLITSRLFTSTMLTLGTFAMLSLASCAGGGQSDQDTEKTEEAAPVEDMNQEAEHPTDEAEHPTESATDTTHHEGHDHPEDEEHPTGGDEHPTGGDEHPN